MSQARLKAVHDEIETLVAKDTLSADETKRLDTLIEEGTLLQQSEESRTKAAKFTEGLRGSTGIPQLVGTRPAGEAHVQTETDTKTGRKSMLVNDSGEMLLDQRTFQTISDPEYGHAFRSYLRGGKENLRSPELRLLQEGVDTAGGFLVPEDILTKVISRLPTPTRVAGRVTRLVTTRDSVAMPKVVYSGDDIYTTGIRVTWTGEVPSSASQSRVTDPVFGQVRIPVYTAMMTLPLTNDMIEDAAFPVVDYVSSKFQETIDLLYDNMCLNGAGLNQPEGILLNPGGNQQPAVIKTGSNAGITPDSLISMIFSLPEQYDMNAAAVFKKTTTGAQIAELKDGNNRYLWGTGLQDSGLAPGWKDRKLMGYDTILSQMMPDPSQNNYPVIFGDLTGYYLVQRLNFSIQVLRELYAESNQIVVLGRVRLGGRVAEEWKLKTLLVST